MIAIVDHGLGNLKSVAYALDRLGRTGVLTADPERIASAEGVILPGVGAFGRAMAGLASGGLLEATRAAAGSGRPFLGICLGLQLLFTESEEMGRHAGLDIIAGGVIRFTHSLKIPQIGWNQIARRQDCPQLEGIEDASYVYFVHSFHVVPEDDSVVATTTDYGYDFVSAIRRGNLFATQFHPEKSSDVGLQMLRNFVGTVEAFGS